MRAPTRMPPRALRAPGASRREPGGADIHTGHCFAALRSAPVSRPQAPRAAKARASAAMARRAVRGPTPAGCACGGAVAGWHARRSARASLSSSPRLSERSAESAQRVLRRTPQPPRRRFAPSHREGVADWGSPFFWVLFFGEAKNKYLGRRAETRPPPSTQACFSNQHAPASTSSDRTAQVNPSSYKNNSHHRLIDKRQQQKSPKKLL